MALSSNSLIHLTHTKEALINILKEDFKIHYCNEKVITSSGTLEYAIPMVSFCDIPLSEIKNHIEKYGTYGIGLKQEWGHKNCLNPVLYIEKNSSLGSGFYNTISEMFKGKKAAQLTESEANLFNIIRYMKNYQADLLRKDVSLPNYRFADEKEWRYVPGKDEATMVIKGLISTPEGKRKLNDAISRLRLSFEPADIKYVIIKNDDEISDFVDVLRKAKGKKYTHSDVERLLTRIITTEQILTDF